MIDRALARAIGLKGPRLRLCIRGIDSRESIEIASEKVEFAIEGQYGQFKVNNAVTNPNLVLTAQSLPASIVKIIKSAENVDITDYYNARPKVLIGQDNWQLIISRECRAVGESLCLSRSSLGWAAHGFLSNDLDVSTTLCIDANAKVKETAQERLCEEIKKLEELIKNNFLLDNFGTSETIRNTHKIANAIKILEDTSRRVGTSWEVGLLWAKGPPPNENGMQAARKRLTTLEHKLDRDPEYANLYYREMERLINNGFAVKVSEINTNAREWYLPHFGVYNPNKSGKIRLVFDAAAKTRGISLNDQLETGPDLLESLPGTLLRFRQYAIALKSDIKDMFLRVKIRKEDRAAQRFLWRGSNRDVKPEIFEMTCLIFGASSSPASAMHIKNKNAAEFSECKREASRSIVRNSYMDDFLTSVATESEAREMMRDVTEINSKANFEMHEWTSNLPHITEASYGKRLLNDQGERKLMDDDKERVLGLRWDTIKDELWFRVNLTKVPTDVLNRARKPTKREVLSAVMSIFDPLGFLAPFVVKSRILMQEICLSGVKWDDQIRDEEYSGWQTWLAKLNFIRECRVPRCLTPVTNQHKDAELHVFCDASLKAYSAVAYARFALDNAHVYISLVAAKCRVASLKPMTIPRLELQAALLGVTLAKSITDELDIPIARRVFWSDSITVLRWIQSEPRTKQIFVANRIGQIHELSDNSEWRWVSSEQNPADDATRWSDSPQKSTGRWLRGPEFLALDELRWPVTDSLSDKEKGEIDSLEIRKSVVLTAVALEPQKFGLYIRCLGWNGLLIIARRVRSAASQWKMFVARRARVPGHQVEKTPRPEITVDSVERAEKFWYLSIQSDCFSEEIKALKRGKPIPKGSKLRKITPYLDAEGYLRANGRVARTLDFVFNNEPIILDGDHPATKMLVNKYHRQYYHANNNTVINEIRQKFYITKLRRILRTIADRCVTCRSQRAKPHAPIMAALPPGRLAYRERPFSHCGLDYFGPLLVKIGRRREKRWGAIFTCLTTRAVHLELAHSLSSSSAIMAVQRMSARRGSPKSLYSDNGTNFRGASRELQEEINALDKTKLKTFANNNKIIWNFNPPEAPHMGGAWERMVRSVKSALHVVLREQAPTEEVLLTVFAEVEHCINSRPLTHVPVDPRDGEALTPNHFLIGSSSGEVRLAPQEHAVVNTRKQYKLVQHFADLIWKRWLHEYLPGLLERQKWVESAEQLKVGDLVLIIDYQAARNEWKKGSIIRTYPGPDGVTRVAKVHTPKGDFVRPAQKLIKLLSAKDVQDA